MAKPHKKKVEHGPKLCAYFSNGEKFMPVIDCLCGWSTGRETSWMDAGLMFDYHLEKVLPRT